MLVALVIHWFNPLVWVMFFLVNKDIEFSCDEKVMNIVGEEYRADYATTLISLAEENNPFSMPIYNGFGKTKIEERIVNIMKFKKSTYVTFLVSTVLICGKSLVFATGNKEINEVESFDLTKNEQSSKNKFSLDSKSTDLYSPKVDSNISFGKSKSDGDVSFTTAKISVKKASESEGYYEETYINKPSNSKSEEEISVNELSKFSDDKDISYADSTEYSIQKSGYDEGSLVILRKGNLLSVNKVQYKTSIK